MKLKLVIAGFCFFILMAGGFSESLLVEYLENSVEIKEDGRWNELEIGDEIPVASILRLGEEAVVELEGDGFKVFINEKGSYNLEDLTSRSRELASWGLNTVVSSKLDTILGADEKTFAASMGVRAADASETDSLFDDMDELVEEGITLINQGQYDKALETLSVALEFVFEESDESWIRYNMARAYMGNGRYVLAQMELMNVKAEPDDDFFSGYVILQGNLHLQGGDFKAADSLFNSYLDKMAEKEPADEQAVRLLASISCRALNKKEAAKKHLERALKIDPASYIGTAAAGLLKEMK